ncbi:hypothetical protein Hte_012544 [Hypoxylon texense]
MAVLDFIRYSAEDLLLIRERAAPLGEYVPTVLLSHELWRSEPRDWDELLSRKVVGCWLAAREREVNYALDGHTEERNDWILILETQERQNVTIELRQADPCGSTVTVCRPGPPLHVVGTVEDGSVHLDGYAYSFRHDVGRHVSVEAWIDRLEKSGATRYQLLYDRGRRYWIHFVLRQLEVFISGDIPSLGSESVMLRIWEFGRELARPKDVHSETGSIIAGRSLPVKLPHNSPLYKFNTVTGGGREIQFPTHWHEGRNKPGRKMDRERPEKRSP